MNLYEVLYRAPGSSNVVGDGEGIYATSATEAAFAVTGRDFHVVTVRRL